MVGVKGLAIRVAMQSVPQRGSVWLRLVVRLQATRYRVVVLTASPHGFQDLRPLTLTTDHGLLTTDRRPFINQPQPLKRQRVINFVDIFRPCRNQRCQSARGDDSWLGSYFFNHALEHTID